MHHLNYFKKNSVDENLISRFWKNFKSKIWVKIKISGHSLAEYCFVLFYWRHIFVWNWIQKIVWTFVNTNKESILLILIGQPDYNYYCWLGKQNIVRMFEFRLTFRVEIDKDLNKSELFLNYAKYLTHNTCEISYIPWLLSL